MKRCFHGERSRPRWARVSEAVSARCRLRACAVLLALAGLLAGCETTNVTTLEENSGAYYDARQFLRVGVTTQGQVVDKYGQPTENIPYEDGTVWRYRKTETVLVNAYTNTPYGTEGSIIGGFGGYQHAVQRRTLLELFFDADGVLTHYRLVRDAP